MPVLDYPDKLAICKASGILNWFDDHGIPHAEEHKPKLSKDGQPQSKAGHITASAVKPVDLQTYLNWSFLHASLRNWTSISSNNILKSIRTSGPLADTNISIPAHWKKYDAKSQVKDPNEARKVCLAIVLQGLESMQPALMPIKVTFETDKGWTEEGLKSLGSNDPLEPKPDDTADIRLCRFILDGEQRSASHLLLNFLLAGTLQDVESEMTVERYVGALFQGFFDLRGFNCKGNQMIKQPFGIVPFASHPKPDIATIYNLKYPGLLEEKPMIFVLAAAEAKQATDDNTDAQLSYCFHGTLIQMLSLFICQNPLEDPHAEQKVSRELPSWMYTMGMTYDRDDVVLSAYYPEWDDNEDDPKWRFVSRIIERFDEAFKQPFPERLRLLRAVLLLQRHAYEVKTHLDEMCKVSKENPTLQLPPSFITLLNSEW